MRTMDCASLPPALGSSLPCRRTCAHGRSKQHRFSVLVSILAQQADAGTIALHRNENQLAQEQLERKNETITRGIGSLEKRNIDLIILFGQRRSHFAMGHHPTAGVLLLLQ